MSVLLDALCESKAHLKKGTIMIDRKFLEFAVYGICQKEKLVKPSGENYVQENMEC